MKKFSEREVRNIEQLKVMATDVYPLKPIKDTYDQLTTVLSGYAKYSLASCHIPSKTYLEYGSLEF